MNMKSSSTGNLPGSKPSPQFNGGNSSMNSMGRGMGAPMGGAQSTMGGASNKMGGGQSMMGGARTSMGGATSPMGGAPSWQSPKHQPNYSGKEHTSSTSCINLLTVKCPCVYGHISISR